MNTYGNSRNTSTKNTLGLIMPGKMTSTLKKLGITTGVTEVELLFQQPDGVHVARTCTIHTLNGALLAPGGQVNTVKWLPAASQQYLFELDSRWCGDATITKARFDWVSLLPSLTDALAKTVVPKEAFFGHRHVAAAAAAAALRRLSGTGGLFVRTPGASSADSKQHTIIWSTKHAEAGPDPLADLGAAIQQIPGHQGLARSWSSIGGRVLWTHSSLARSLLCTDDPRFGTPAPLQLRDDMVSGLPAGVTPEELSRAQSWLTIPQRRLSQRDGRAVWLVSSDKNPPCYFFAGGRSV
eukprot:6477756-Amphidinium_carterae.4